MHRVTEGNLAQPLAKKLESKTESKSAAVQSELYKELYNYRTGDVQGKRYLEIAQMISEKRNELFEEVQQSPATKSLLTEVRIKICADASKAGEFAEIEFALKQINQISDGVVEPTSALPKGKLALQALFSSHGENPNLFS